MSKRETSRSDLVDERGSLYAVDPCELEVSFTLDVYDDDASGEGPVQSSRHFEARPAFRTARRRQYAARAR